MRAIFIVERAGFTPEAHKHARGAQVRFAPASCRVFRRRRTKKPGYLEIKASRLFSSKRTTGRTRGFPSPAFAKFGFGLKFD